LYRRIDEARNEIPAIASVEEYTYPIDIVVQNAQYTTWKFWVPVSYRKWIWFVILKEGWNLCIMPKMAVRIFPFLRF